MKLLEFPKQAAQSSEDFVKYLTESLKDAEEGGAGPFTTFVCAGMTEEGTVIFLGNANVVDAVFLAESLKQFHINAVQEWE
jgi:hypothetical protein